MRVLFWMFSGFDQHSTSEHLLLSIIEQLCIQGHSVNIIQMNTGGSQPAIPEMFSKYQVTTNVVPFKTVDKGNFIARYLAGLKYIYNSQKYITPDYDAVFIQSNNEAGFALWFIRKKLPNAIVTFNVQDIFPYNAAFSGNVKKNSVVFKILASIQRYGYKHSDRIITISEDMKDTLVADGTDVNKIRVIYNWSYQDRLYEKQDFSQVSHILNSRYFNVVYAGNIGIMQNVDIIIEAAKRLKEDQSIRFHIVGNGVYKAKLEAKSKAYGITNIYFWPIQPPKLAPIIYNAADVNVIPLVKEGYRTALPSKTATCLACQKPIVFAIGKDSKFGKAISQEDYCKVIDSDNSEDLVRAIYYFRTTKPKSSNCTFYLMNMQKSKNANQYALIITTGELGK